MAKDLGDQESFDLLLAWLAPNREAAAQKYEKIREKLRLFFFTRGFSNAENLADLVIIRGTQKVSEIIEDYEGEPLKYFYGVAKFVLLEEVATNKETELIYDPRSVAEENPAEEFEAQEQLNCLEKCLQQLKSKERDLLLDYYESEKHIARRRELAKKFNLTMNALRLKVFHYKLPVENCVKNCLGEKNEKKMKKK